MNFNMVILCGRLTRDPEKRQAGSTVIASFGLAVNNRKKNSATGQYENVPMFLDCTAFGRTAETVCTYAKKGGELAVQGKLEQQEWTDKATGAKRSKICVIVSEVVLGDKLKANQQQAATGEPEPVAAYGPDAVIPF